MVNLVPLQLKQAHGGSGELWVNPEHIVTLQPIRSTTGASVSLDVEVKMSGMNLVRVRAGVHASEEAADAAWIAFLQRLGLERSAPHDRPAAKAF